MIAPTTALAIPVRFCFRCGRTRVGGSAYRPCLCRARRRPGLLLGMFAAVTGLDISAVIGGCPRCGHRPCRMHGRDRGPVPVAGFRKLRGPPVGCALCIEPIGLGQRFAFTRLQSGEAAMVHSCCAERERWEEENVVH